MSNAYERMKASMDRAKEHTTYSGFPSITFSKDGTYRFRILPSNDRFDVFRFYGMHYFGINKPKEVAQVECRRLALNEPCPVCELLDKLPRKKADRNEAQQQLHDLLYVSPRFAFLAIDRSDKTPIIRCLYANKTVGNDIIKLLSYPSDASKSLEIMQLILDPIKGGDFTAKVTKGDYKKGKKDEVEIMVDILAINTGGTPIIATADGKFDEAAYNKLVETAPDWDAIVNMKSYDEAQEQLFTNLGLIDIDMSVLQTIMADDGEVEAVTEEEEEEVEVEQEQEPEPTPVKIQVPSPVSAKAKILKPKKPVEPETPKATEPEPVLPPNDAKEKAQTLKEKLLQMQSQKAKTQ